MYIKYLPLVMILRLMEGCGQGFSRFEGFAIQIGPTATS